MLFNKYLALLFALISLRAVGQDIESTLSKFEKYHKQTPFEKAYLHTDKEVYAQNETLWFSAYLVDATTHRPKTPSSLVYVDLFGPENKLVSSLSIKIINGNGQGEFFLADSLAEGSYTLLAYTKYMKNFGGEFFFSKSIKLLKFSSDNQVESGSKLSEAIDFQVFPEGGHILAGMSNIVAFKAINKEGAGVNVTGNIINGKDEVIKKFKSQHLGMGKFQISPQVSENYFIEYNFNNRSYTIPFPEIKTNGYQLFVRQDASKTYITVKASPGLSFDDCFVLVHSRGMVVSVIKASHNKNFIYNVLDNNQLPSGILHMTVFKSGEPILERLAFVDNASDNVPLTTHLLNKSLRPREKAIFELSSLKNDSIQYSGSVSISVQKSSQPANKVTIENVLLLSADLQGTIENPDYYFNKSNFNRRNDLDLVMLTHGWRRFNWQNVLSDSLPPITFYPENGFTIEGQVVRYYNRKKGQKTNLVLSFLEDMSIRMEAETLDDGTFWFDDLQVNDTATAVIRAVEKDNKKSRKKKNKGKVDEIRDTGTYIGITNQEIPNPPLMYGGSYGTKDMYRQQLDQQLEIEQIIAEFDEKTIVLEEIKVAAMRDRKTDPYYRDYTSMPYNRPDTRVILDSIDGPSVYYSIYNMVSRVLPMVQVKINKEGLKEFTYRGDSLVVYLDGMPLINPLQLAAINPESVEFIDLMRGFTALNTGAPRKALFLFSRSTAKKSDPIGFQLLKMYGYHHPAEFYVPKYDLMTAKEKLKPDYRTTQYWNPNVKLENGKSSFSYFTSDNLGQFIMYLEGITIDGKIIRQEFKFEVN